MTPTPSPQSTAEQTSDRIARRMGAEFVQREPSTAEPSVEQRAREMLAVEVPQHLRHIVLTAPMAELGYSFQYALRAITKALQSTAELADVEQKPLRLCGYCQSWNSKPCGEQCCWSINDPTQEQLEAKALQSTAEAATLIEKLGEKLLLFVEIIDGTGATGFDPHVEQMLIDAAEESREALSLISGVGVRS